MDKVLYYLITLLKSALFIVGIPATYEEPRYAVVERLDRSVEVRNYEGRVAVETGARAGRRSGAYSATSPEQTPMVAASL